MIRCSAWAPSLGLHVKCDGSSGQWEPEDPNSETPPLDNEYTLATADNKLNDLQCVPENNPHELTVPKAGMGAGAQLSCTTEANFKEDETKENFIITAPNECILICDFHLGMTIEGKLHPETGDWAFFCLETGTEITGSEVRCWP